MMTMDRALERASLEWLTTLTEEGVIDEVMGAFVAELVPYAKIAAARQLRRHLAAQDPELMIGRLRDFLVQLASTLDGIAMNPDMMAVAHSSASEIVRSMNDISDWIFMLDHRDGATQATVHPSAAIVLADGGTP